MTTDDEIIELNDKIYTEELDDQDKTAIRLARWIEAKGQADLIETAKPVIKDFFIKDGTGYSQLDKRMEREYERMTNELLTAIKKAGEVKP